MTRPNADVLADWNRAEDLGTFRTPDWYCAACNTPHWAGDPTDEIGCGECGHREEA